MLTGHMLFLGFPSVVFIRKGRIDLGTFSILCLT